MMAARDNEARAIKKKVKSYGDKRTNIRKYSIPFIIRQLCYKLVYRP